jgi:hypothetical protein
MKRRKKTNPRKKSKPRTYYRGLDIRVAVPTYLISMFDHTNKRTITITARTVSGVLVQLENLGAIYSGPLERMS